MQNDFVFTNYRRTLLSNMLANGRQKLNKLIYIRLLSQIQCGKFGLSIEINKMENGIVFGLCAPTDHTQGGRRSKIAVVFKLIFLLAPRKMIIIR